MILLKIYIGIDRPFYPIEEGEYEKIISISVVGADSRIDNDFM